MTKRLISLLLCAAMLVLCAAIASAEVKTGVAYGVYSGEGEHPDSLIRVTLTVEDGVITAAKMDDKLIPVAIGGAAGWAELDEATAAELDEAVVSANGKTYPATISMDDIVWQAVEDAAAGVAYVAEINGEQVELMAYACTDEGGAWYYEQQTAQFLAADGEVVAEIELGTKESIGHGVGFWPSEITFPGNIANIEAFVVANGAAYDESTIAMGEDGAWAVADVTTGATLAGTPNYLRIAKAAYENATK